MSDHDRGDDCQADLLERFEPPCRVAEILVGRDHGDEEGDERSRNPIVESALDVQRSPDPYRNGPVGDNRQAERRVRRGQDGGDQGCRRPPDPGKHEVRQHCAGNHGQRQSDEQQSAG
jgi:hypothetical protein